MKLSYRESIGTSSDSGIAVSCNLTTPLTMACLLYHCYFFLHTFHSFVQYMLCFWITVRLCLLQLTSTHTLSPLHLLLLFPAVTTRYSLPFFIVLSDSRIVLHLSAPQPLVPPPPFLLPINPSSSTLASSCLTPSHLVMLANSQLKTWSIHFPPQMMTNLLSSSSWWRNSSSYFAWTAHNPAVFSLSYIPCHLWTQFAFKCPSHYSVTPLFISQLLNLIGYKLFWDEVMGEQSYSLGTHCSNKLWVIQLKRKQPSLQENISAYDFKYLQLFFKRN